RPPEPPAAFASTGTKWLRRLRWCRGRCGLGGRVREALYVDARERRGRLHVVIEARGYLLHAVPREQRGEDGLACVGLAVVDERGLHLGGDIGWEVLTDGDAIVRNRPGGVDDFGLRLDVGRRRDEAVTRVDERRRAIDGALIDRQRR